MTKFLFLDRILPSRVPRTRTAARIFAGTSRGEINKMASKITSASEVNTGFLSPFLFLIYVKVSLSTSLKVAMKVRMTSDSDVCSSIFSDKSSREDSLDMSYEESQSAQDNLQNVSRAAIWVYKE